MANLSLSSSHVTSHYMTAREIWMFDRTKSTNIGRELVSINFSNDTKSVRAAGGPRHDRKWTGLGDTYLGPGLAA